MKEIDYLDRIVFSSKEKDFFSQITSTTKIPREDETILIEGQEYIVVSVCYNYDLSKIIVHIKEYNNKL